jgi:hypothetical protein
MALAGLASVVEYHLGDGPATLARAVDRGRRFSVVHLDPPWRGNYQYDLTRPFMLEGLKLREDGTLGLHTRGEARRLGVGKLPKRGTVQREWLTKAAHRSVRTVSGGAFESNRRKHWAAARSA